MTDQQKIAVISGGAQGLGLAAAEWFLAHGYKVALWDIDATTLDRTVARINDSTRVFGIYCDVSKPEAVAAAAAHVWGHYGRVDALVNNAGVASYVNGWVLAVDDGFDPTGVGLPTLRRTSGRAGA